MISNDCLCIIVGFCSAQEVLNLMRCCSSYYKIVKNSNMYFPVKLSNTTKDNIYLKNLTVGRNVRLSGVVLNHVEQLKINDRSGSYIPDIYFENRTLPVLPKLKSLYAVSKLQFSSALIHCTDIQLYLPEQYSMVVTIPHVPVLQRLTLAGDFQIFFQDDCLSVLLECNFKDCALTNIPNFPSLKRFITTAAYFPCLIIDANVWPCCKYLELNRLHPKSVVTINNMPHTHIITDCYLDLNYKQFQSVTLKNVSLNTTLCDLVCEEIILDKSSAHKIDLPMNTKITLL